MTQPAQTNNQTPGGLPPIQNIAPNPNNLGQQAIRIQQPQAQVQQTIPVTQQIPNQQTPAQPNTFNPVQVNQVNPINSNNQNKSNLLPKILMTILVLAILGEAAYIVYTLFIK